MIFPHFPSQLSTAFVTTVILVILSGEASSETIRFPEIPEGERVLRTFRITKKPADNSLSEQKTGVLPKEVTSTYKIFKAGERKFLDVLNSGTLVNGNRNEVILRIEEGTPPRAVLYFEREWGKGGNIIREGFFRFDDASYSYPQGLYHVLMLPIILRGIEFREDARGYIYVWAGPAILIGIEYEVEGLEKITVPAGEFESYRVDLTPDLRSIIPLGSVLYTILKPFVPSYSFWFAKDKGHPLVKYEGIGGGPGAAMQVGELKSIDYEGKWSPSSFENLGNSVIGQ